MSEREFSPWELREEEEEQLCVEDTVFDYREDEEEDKLILAREGEVLDTGWKGALIDWSDGERSWVPFRNVYFDGRKWCYVG